MLYPLLFFMAAQVSVAPVAAQKKGKKNAQATSQTDALNSYLKPVK